MRFAERYALLIFFFSTLVLPAAALCDDDPPIAWGEIPREQLEMKTFPADTNATAVILCDFGEVTFNEREDLVFTRHTRIKILTKAGFNWGTDEIPYKDEGSTQIVEDIEGVTYSLGPDGSVVESELESESIYDEALVEGWHKKKFTLPKLIPGCVIEYRYTVISKNPYYMPDWYFQSDEPTLLSEYRVKAPAKFSYSSMTNSTLPFFIDETTSLRAVVPTPSGAEIGVIQYTHYVMKDVPAVREEPYMTTVDDFRARVFFQLSSINLPDRSPVKVMNTWDKVAEEFNGLEIFGKQLDGTGAIGDRADKLVEGVSDPRKKIEAIYDFVRVTMVWDERERIFCSRDLDDVLESKKGSSAEINILLISMLRKAGIHAAPVLLSTRDHGKILKIYPIIEQFNYLIVSAEANGTRYLLDATDRYHPFAFLPARALNHTGFLIDGKTSEWIRVEPVVATESTTLAALTLQPDGSVRGKIQKSFTGHLAVIERDTYSDEKPEDYMKQLLKTEAFGLTLDSTHVSNANDVRQPFLVETSVSSALCTQAMGGFIYMTPLLMERSTENPFKSEKRKFPVDYAYPRTEQYTLQLTIPDGYTVKEAPRDLSISLPGQGGSYTRTSAITGKTIALTVVMTVTRTVFEPSSYAALRSAYDQIVASEAEQIVVQKKGLYDPNAPTPK